MVAHIEFYRTLDCVMLMWIMVCGVVVGDWDDGWTLARLCASRPARPPYKDGVVGELMQHVCLLTA